MISAILACWHDPLSDCICFCSTGAAMYIWLCFCIGFKQNSKSLLLAHPWFCFLFSCIRRHVQFEGPRIDCAWQSAHHAEDNGCRLRSLSERHRIRARLTRVSPPLLFPLEWPYFFAIVPSWRTSNMLDICVLKLHECDEHLCTAAAAFALLPVQACLICRQ